MKKILMCFIVFAMMLTVNAMAAETNWIGYQEGSAEANSNVVWSLDNEGTLYITGNGLMLNSIFQDDYLTYLKNMENSENNPYKAWNKEQVRKVVITGNITHIADCAFAGCKNLENIQFNSPVQYVGENTFEGCSKLVELVFPEGLLTIGNNCFKRCHNLIKINLPGSLMHIGDNAFKNCSSLDSITIPVSTRLGSVSNQFDGCESLKEINVHDGNEFYTSVDGILFNKAKTTIIKAPEGKHLGNYEIPYGVKRIGANAFRDCKMLYFVGLPETLVEIRNMAFLGSGIREIIIPNNVKEVGPAAFMDCQELANVKLSDSLTTISRDMFWNCTRLTNITIPYWVELIESDAFGNCTTLTRVTINGIELDIESGAFDNTAIMIEESPIVGGVIGLGEHKYINAVTAPRETEFEVEELDENRVIITRCMTSEEFVVIPDYIEGKFVAQIESEAFTSRNCFNLKTVYMPQEHLYMNRDINNIFTRTLNIVNGKPEIENYQMNFYLQQMQY